MTSPTLDLQDFIGISFTTGPDGKIYQLPDQQFANLYWFRYDWFSDPDLQAQFAEKYGYPLGVPVNWSAYEDIAEFFSNHVKQIDGQQIYGHMDYGKKDPSLGWRLLMLGCLWLVPGTRVFPMVCPLMSGVFELRTVGQWVHRSVAVALLMDPQQFMRCKSILIGSLSTRRLKQEV